MLAKRTGWLVATIVSLAVIGACGGMGQIEDSPEARKQWAAKIVKLEIESGDLDQRLDRGADLGQASSIDPLQLELGRELTERELVQVRDVMRRVLAEYLTPEVWTEILTQVYADNFTAAEMKTIFEFFESPAGSKILGSSSRMTKEIDDLTDAMFEGRVDELVNRIDEELGKAFPALQEGGS